MSDSGDYDEYAAQCIRQAQANPAPEMRVFLLMMAQTWLRLGAMDEQSRSVVGKIEGEQTR
jgi:hypothetical protein